MYKVKEFVGNYDKDLFYSIMGKFFAERSYRKKLPYLINDKDKFWYIFFRKEELIGFCSIKIGQKCTSFPDLYILDDENLDDLLFIINYMFNLYKMENIKILTCKSNEIKFLKQLGFEETGSKGCYTNMLWESKREN
jgi:hypothetical protein